jgi:outer membrane protein OmpA-like peptidoglycan-associated protein
MPGFYLDQSNNRDFDRYSLYDGSKLVPVEGRVYQSEYRLKYDITSPPSELQILRNYTNAITAKGGAVLFEGEAEGYGDERDGRTLATGRFQKDGKDIWVEVFPAGGEWLRLTVVEKQAMRQDITAGEMLETITKKGHVALDVHFDTGKAVIREESRPIISQIVTMLEGSPSLKLRIEGHTDNVGESRKNKKLSESRARAVLDAIVAEGIAADRLTAVGFGQEKPVGDNGTEEGRAKNRRVELVKQ